MSRIPSLRDMTPASGRASTCSLEAEQSTGTPEGLDIQGTYTEVDRTPGAAQRPCKRSS